MSIVRLENVSKAFAGQSVLEGVSLRVEAGEHIGLIGRNGTGKSTIFR
ncbi:MAG: ATP-binding cassette domain-containing protein, partial [Candidatus Hydrogenedentes bacterium]|nr:ATP-binding cassette domain-containing protein [Candidatus Hydrogenedentota bacterium]